MLRPLYPVPDAEIVAVPACHVPEWRTRQKLQIPKSGASPICPSLELFGFGHIKHRIFFFKPESFWLPGVHALCLWSPIHRCTLSKHDGLIFLAVPEGCLMTPNDLGLNVDLERV